MGESKTKYPPPTPRLPYENHSPPVGHFMAPCRCPLCEDIPDIFSLPPYSFDDPDPPTYFENLFPPDYTPFPDLNTATLPTTDARLPTPSIPLEPPPPYDYLFATGVPSDSVEAPQFTGTTLIYGTLMLGWAGTCSSSPPVQPPIP